MAGQIRLTPEEMRGRSREYTAESEKFQDVIAKMQSLLDQLQMEWEGESSIAFADRFESLKPSFNETKRLIEEIAAQLMTTADALETLDMDLASKIRG